MVSLNRSKNRAENALTTFQTPCPRSAFRFYRRHNTVYHELTIMIVKTPDTIMTILKFSSLPRPLPRLAPPLIRTFHQCHGRRTEMDLNRPMTPMAVKPFVKCHSQVFGCSSRIHPVISSYSKSSPMPVAKSRRKAIGSQAPKRKMGSATKPSRNIHKININRVNAARTKLLVAHLPQVNRRRWYRYLHVGHSSRFLSAFDAVLQALKQPSWTYFCVPLHSHGRISRPSSGSSET